MVLCLFQVKLVASPYILSHLLPPSNPLLPPRVQRELRKFHIVTSAQGMAVHWQIRIHYYW